jgi:regulator of sigma E protease
MLTILSFIFVLGLLIFFHELGHFLVAKKVGIRVDSFSLGFPPHIFKHKRGETTYCIGIIPLGGYVKMAGENPDEESTGAPGEFMSKSVGRRAAVIFAGPFANYLLAIVTLVGVHLYIGVPWTDESQIVVGQVIEEGPASEAGLLPNDQIIAIDGVAVSSFDSMRVMINAKVEVPIEVAWLHGSDTIRQTITTDQTEMPNLSGSVDTVGVIGITEKVNFNHNALEAVSYGIAKTHEILYMTVSFVKQLVTGQVSSKMLGGPIFIAQQAGAEARAGLPNLLYFMALLSVNLAILNVLPIPVLDGGQLVFLLIEKIIGRPLSMNTRIKFQYVGILAVISLTVFVTYNDIMRLFGQ